MLARAGSRRREQYAVRPLVAAVLLVVVACQPAGSGSPQSSPAVRTSSASSSPSTSPSTSASVLDDRFGLVLIDGHGMASVRSETSDRAITSFSPQGRSWTSLSADVSPDGRAIAYWAPANDGAVLHVRSAIDGGDRVVFTAAKDMSGNTFAWSTDGTGIVVMIDNNCQEICALQGGHPAQELWTVDIAAGASEKVAAGSYWLPVAWDRASKRIAAGVTGPGGYLTGYNVIDLSQRPYAVSSSASPFSTIGRLKASTDARFILLIGSGASPTLSWWPIDAPQKRVDVRTFNGTTAEWRPATNEIWWSSGSELVALDAAKGTQTSTAGTFGDVVGFRIDGSAVMTQQRPPTAIVVVDLKSTRTAMLPNGGPFVRVR